MIAVLCGGVGAARFLAGLVQVVPPADVVAIVNTGDDTELHGLSISPDLDTVTYTLAGAVDASKGWGLRDETFAAMEALERYGAPTWFRLGDRDLATHLYRTARLREGATLSEVTSEVRRAWGVEVGLVPMSDDAVRTRLTLLDGSEIAFQEYFVRLHHEVAVAAVSFEGAAGARPAPGVLEALDSAETVVIAPSNPVVSIGPVLAVPGVREVLARRRGHVVAVSPIVAGRALKGPAARLLTELGVSSSVTGVAEWYLEVAGTLVVDEADRELAPAVRRVGMSCAVADTVMADPGRAAALARAVLGAGPA